MASAVTLPEKKKKKDIASKKFCKILGMGSFSEVTDSISHPQKLQVLSKQKKSFLIS